MPYLSDFLEELKNNTETPVNNQEETNKNNLDFSSNNVSGDPLEQQRNIESVLSADENEITSNMQDKEGFVGEDTYSQDYSNADMTTQWERSLMKGVGEYVIKGTGDMLQILGGAVPGLNIIEGNYLSRTLQEWGTEFADEYGQQYIPEELRTENLSFKSLANPEFWSIHFAQYVPQIAQFIFMGKAAQKGGVFLAKKAGKGYLKTGLKAGVKKVIKNELGEVATKIGKGAIDEAGNLSKGAEFLSGTVTAGVVTNQMTGMMNAAQAINQRKDNPNWDEQQLKELAAGIMRKNTQWMALDILSWGLTYNGGWKGIANKMGSKGILRPTVETLKETSGLFSKTIKPLFGKVASKVTSIGVKAGLEGLEESFQETFEDWTELKSVEDITGHNKYSSYMDYYMSDDSRATRVISFASGLGGGVFGNITQSINKNANDYYKIYNKQENLKTRFSKDHLEGRTMQRQFINEDIKYIVMDGRTELYEDYINGLMKAKGIDSKEEASFRKEYDNVFEKYKETLSKAKLLNVKGKNALLNHVLEKDNIDIQVEDANLKYEEKKKALDELSSTDFSDSKKNELHKKFKSERDLTVKGLLASKAKSQLMIDNLLTGKEATEQDIQNAKHTLKQNEFGDIETEISSAGLSKEQYNEYIKQSDEDIYKKAKEERAKEESEKKKKTMGGKLKNIFNSFWNKEKNNENVKDTKEDTSESNTETTEETKSNKSSIINDYAQDNEIEDLSDIGDNLKSVTKEDSKVIFKESKESLDIESIEVPKEKRKQGNAKRALKEITNLADKYNKEVSLRVNPKDSSISEEGLVKLYEQNGFKKANDFDTSKKMVRKPNENNVDENPNENKNFKKKKTETNEFVKKIKNVIDDSKETDNQELTTDIMQKWLKTKQIPFSVLKNIAEKISNNKSLSTEEKALSRVYSKAINDLSETTELNTNQQELYNKTIEHLKKRKEKAKKKKAKINIKTPNAEGNIFGMKKKAEDIEVGPARSKSILTQMLMQKEFNEEQKDNIDNGNIEHLGLKNSYDEYVNSAEIELINDRQVINEMMVVNQRLKELFPGSGINVVALNNLYDEIGVSAVGYALGSTYYIQTNEWNQGPTFMHEFSHIFYQMMPENTTIKAVINQSLKTNPQLYKNIEKTYFDYVLYKFKNGEIKTANETVLEYTGESLKNIDKETYTKAVEDAINKGDIVKKLPIEEQPYLLEEVFTHTMQGPLSENMNKFFVPKYEVKRQNIVKRFWNTLKKNSETNSLLSPEEVASMLTSGENVPAHELNNFFINGFQEAIKGKTISGPYVGMASKLNISKKKKTIQKSIKEETQNINFEEPLFKETYFEQDEEIEDVLVPAENTPMDIIGLSFQQKVQKATKIIDNFTHQYNKVLRRIKLNHPDYKNTLFDKDEFKDEFYSLARDTTNALDFINELETSDTPEVKTFLEYIKKNVNESPNVLLSNMWAVYNSGETISGFKTRTVDGKIQLETTMSNTELNKTQNILDSLAYKLSEESERESLLETIEKIKDRTAKEKDYRDFLYYITDSSIHLDKILGKQYLFVNGRRHFVSTVIKNFVDNNMHKQDKYAVYAYNFKPLVDAIVDTNRRYTYKSSVLNVEGNMVQATQTKSMLTREMDMMRDALKANKNGKIITKKEFVNKFSHYLGDTKGYNNQFLSTLYDNYKKYGMMPEPMRYDGLESKNNNVAFDKSNPIEQQFEHLSMFIHDNKVSYNSQITIFGTSPRNYYMKMPKYNNAKKQTRALGVAYEIYKNIPQSKNSSGNLEPKLTKAEFVKEAKNISELKKQLESNAKSLSEISEYKKLFTNKKLNANGIKTLIDYKVSQIINAHNMIDVFAPTLAENQLMKYIKTASSPVFNPNKNMKVMHLFFKDEISKEGTDETDGTQYILPEQMEMWRNAYGKIMDLRYGGKFLNHSIEKTNPNFKGQTILGKSYTVVLTDEYVKANPKLAIIKTQMQKQWDKYKEWHKKEYGTDVSNILTDGTPNVTIIATPQSSMKTNIDVDFDSMTLDGIESNPELAEWYYDNLYYDKGNFIGLEGYNFGVQQIMDKIYKETNTPVQMLDSVLTGANELGQITEAEDILKSFSDVMDANLQKNVLNHLENNTEEEYSKFIKKRLDLEAMNQLQRFEIEEYGILQPSVNTIVRNQLVNTIKKQGNKIKTKGTYAKAKPGGFWRTQKYHTSKQGSQGLSGLSKNNDGSINAAEIILPKHMDNDGLHKRELFTLEKGGGALITSWLKKNKRNIKENAFDLPLLKEFIKDLAIKRHKKATKENADNYVLNAYDDNGKHVGYFLRGENIIATRVPSDGPHSTGVFEIIDFDVVEGNEAMTNKEFHDIMGGDFDGDSLFIQTKNNDNRKINEGLEKIEDMWLSPKFYQYTTSKIEFKNKVNNILDNLNKFKKDKKYLIGSPETRMQNYTDTMTSRNNIGSVFVLHKMMNLFSAYNVELTNPIRIKGFNEFTQFKDWGNGSDSRYIQSAIIANIILDNQKHQTASKLGITDHTINQVVQLINLGLPLENVTAIMNHPIILKYNEVMNSNNTDYSESVAYKTILDKLKNEKAKTNKEVIADFNNKDFNSKENANAIIDLFSQLELNKSQMNGISKILSGHKTVEAEPYVLEKQIQDFDKAINNNIDNQQFKIPEQLKDNPHVKRLRNVAQIALNKTKKLSMIHNINGTKVLKETLEMININEDDLTEKQIKEISKKILVFDTARLLGFNNITKEYYNELISEDKSSNSAYNALKEHLNNLHKPIDENDKLGTPKISKNLLLSKGLNYKVNGNVKYISLNPSYFESGFNKEEYHVMKKEFSELPLDLQNKLVLYDLVKHGWQGALSFAPLFDDRISSSIAFQRRIKFENQDKKIAPKVLSELKDVIIKQEFNNPKNKFFKLNIENITLDKLASQILKNPMLNKKAYKPIFEEKQFKGSTSNDFTIQVNYKSKGRNRKALVKFTALNAETRNKIAFEKNSTNRKMMLKLAIEKNLKSIKIESKGNDNIDLIAIPDASNYNYFDGINKQKNNTNQPQGMAFRPLYQYSDKGVMSQESFNRAMEFDSHVTEEKRKVTYEIYKREKKIANKIAEKINDNTTKAMSKEKLLTEYNKYSTKEGYAWAIVTKPLIKELTARMMSEQSNLTKRIENGKDIGVLQSWLMANNIPSNHPAVQGLVREVNKKLKNFQIEKTKYAKEINKATDALYQEKLGFSVLRKGFINTFKKGYNAFFRNRKTLYQQLYGNLLEIVEHEQEDGIFVREMRLHPPEIIEEEYQNGKLSKAEYDFYKVFTKTTNELRPFSIKQGGKSRQDYIPHTSMGTFEMLYNRGLLGMLANSKTEEEHLGDVKLYLGDELMSFSDIKNNYFAYAKENGKDLKAIKDYTKLLLKAKKHLKKGINEDGTNIEYSNIQNISAVDMGGLLNRFENKRSDKASENPSMDLNKALLDYVHSTLFVNGNGKFKGVKDMLPYIDGVLSYNDEKKYKKLNKYVKRNIKDFFLKGKRQSSLGPVGDKLLKAGVFGNLIYLLGYKAFVVGKGLYMIGNVAAGKYHNIRNNSGKEWLLGESRFWGVDKGLKNPIEIIKRKKRAQNILKNIGYMEVNVYDDIQIQQSGQLDSFIADLALLPMTWSEEWIQGVHVLGMLTEEEMEKFDEEGNYKPGEFPIDTERINKLEDHITRSHGRGYQINDQRMIQMYSWGQAMMQFNRFIPSMFDDRFAKQDVDIYGQKQIGSLTAIKNGIGKAITEMDPKAFIRYRNSLSPSEKNRFDAGLKGMAMSTVAMFVALGSGSKTAHDLFWDANYYADTDRLLYKGIPSVGRTIANITGVL